MLGTHSDAECPSESFVLEKVVEQDWPYNTAERRPGDREAQSDATPFLERESHAHQAGREEKAVAEADEEALG